LKEVKRGKKKLVRKRGKQGEERKDEGKRMNRSEEIRKRRKRSAGG
jgi:hypothetical protein